ncbi:Ulp1 protease family C-terminal catalytic domain [Arabidopsis suecica]|uniref:Ulp1 protease family C-terminal catalytic domain n=1 Tax=Arabidopsis suecica TaxID=45249 RepID=A0A8T1XVJ8_ARASU|nr:Ulp1 protease family C-terminal catalytic domain [Arabidopsis suecica]
MEDLDLPHRLIAAGEEPLGERVNVYNKMKILNGIIDSLDATEINLIRDSPLGGLLDFPNKPAWSASFGLYLLGRQLDIAKANEIWVVYAGTPVRFSLREFHLVTGLACGRYPDVPKKKRKGTAGKEIPFYSTLFGLESDVTVERVITMLKKKVTNDPSLRIRYAVLALVDGYLLPTSHHPKIIKEHAEMSENLTSFLTYPWGRLTFEMMMNSIKERELEQLATTSVAVQGLLYALQLVVLQAAPAIQEGPVSEETVGSESDEDTIELHPRQVVPFKLGNAKVLDTKCQTHVDPIIHPGVLLDPAEDVSWSDDEVDPRVDTMVKLAEEGFKFNNDMFPGGCIPSEVVVAPKKQKRSATLKGGRVRKSSKQGRIPKNPTGIRRTKQTVHNVEESVVLVDMNALSRMLDGKLNAQYKKIIKGVTDWFIANTLISAENGKDVPAENGKEVPADKGKGKKVTVPQSNPLHLSDGDDDFDTLFPLRPPSHRSSRVGKVAHRVSQVPGEGLGLDNSVEGIASYYNGLFPGDCSGSRAADGVANHVDDEENGLGICQVMDALLKFSRHILRTDEVDGEKLRVDVLDTKFISQLCRLYPKFTKAPASQDFQFPTALVDAVCGVGELDRAELFTEVDYLYLPFNFDKKHWVALCVDLNCAKIIVLDSNVHLRTDASIKVDIEPLSKMLPILFRQAASNPIMSQLLPTPFSVERSLCIPQVTSHVDAGLMTIFLIHAHAAGGMDACAEFLPECIEAETKKLVSAIILAGVP